jgi:hypothetical protein
MQTPKTDAESVQLWITVGQQPGLGGWLNVWLVSRSRRPIPAKAAAAKKLPQGALIA